MLVMGSYGSNQNYSSSKTNQTLARIETGNDTCRLWKALEVGGSPCIFPFLLSFWGRQNFHTHISCAPYLNGRNRVCATTVDSDGVAKSIGMCNDKCTPRVTHPHLCKHNHYLLL